MSKKKIMYGMFIVQFVVAVVALVAYLAYKAVVEDPEVLYWLLGIAAATVSVVLLALGIKKYSMDEWGE